MTAPALKVNHVAHEFIAFDHRRRPLFDLDSAAYFGGVALEAIVQQDRICPVIDGHPTADMDCIVEADEVAVDQSAGSSLKDNSAAIDTGGVMGNLVAPDIAVAASGDHDPSTVGLGRIVDDPILDYSRRAAGHVDTAAVQCSIVYHVAVQQQRVSGLVEVDRAARLRRTIALEDTVSHLATPIGQIDAPPLADPATLLKNRQPSIVTWVSL